MILHEKDGWAITQTMRWVHLCQPLGSTCMPGLFAKTGFMRCLQCGLVCPTEVDQHLVKVIKFIKSTS